ncbi:MAG: queuine tRNA-ribosyltransferase [candidate division Zixibacteria bacterium SM23_73_3]|nr:MAG: queuine tRNA-ribosyltransferase [candidate division Zixibacteria bacterium SM23_73_3]
MDNFEFRIVKRDKNSKARVGVIKTPHGEVNTPIFMPVGTQASVKTLSSEDLKEIGAEMILGNTYHLYLRPGEQLVEKAGGLHKFMNWDRPILTDSGGFQVFSLNSLTKTSEQGVRFQSHLDGSYHLFTPEKVVEIQHALGADIIMVLDEPVFYPCSMEQAKRANQLTLNWAKRCKEAHKELEDKGFKHKQALFGIIQGSTYPELRKNSASALMKLDFPGYAIGGLSLGEPKSTTFEMVDLCVSYIPEQKPRYLMGVGTPEDMVEAISQGIDMFDCVLPTRNARNASLFTRLGKLIIKNSEYADDFSPIDSECGCSTCRNYSRAYLRHLFNTGEVSALRLATIHSLYFYMDLMKMAKDAILKNRFLEWKMEFLKKYHSNEKDEENKIGNNQTGEGK